MKEYKCACCGDTFTKSDIKDFREMHEKYYLFDGVFLCPDCYDDLQSKDLEGQLDYLLSLQG